MLETAATVGIGAVMVLQLANLWQGRRTSQKLDCMVTKERCDERRETIQKDIAHANIRIMNHEHNGDNVKVTKV